MQAVTTIGLDIAKSVFQSREMPCLLGAAAIHQHGHRAARHVLPDPGWRHMRGRPPNASIQNNSGLPQGLAGSPCGRLRCRKTDKAISDDQALKQFPPNRLTRST
jgi:hypothetical protein